MRRISALILLTVFTLIMVSCSTSLFSSEKDYAYTWENITASDQARFDAVKTFADNIITNAKDSYKDKKGGKTPLFANGINIETGELAIWRNLENEEHVFSNFATQQNFMRLLDGLTKLTDNPKYKKAATDAAAYMLKNYTSKNGLIYWGGHAFIDLKTGEYKGPSGDPLCHELKFAYPYYELLNEVDSDATSKSLAAIWSLHVTDWEKFDINRHGRYTWKYYYPFDKEIKDFPVRIATTNLSFINGGSDIMLAGFMEYILNGNKKAYDWSKTLIGMYIKARNPDTGLGAYQYNYYELENGSEGYVGDRAYLQMGEEFGSSATEVDIIENGNSIYALNPLMLLYVYDNLPQKDEELLTWCVQGLEAYQKYAYDYEKQMISPIFADGTDLTGYILQRDGYFGKAGSKTYKKMKPSPILFLSAMRTAIRSDNEVIWNFARSMGDALDVGDIGDIKGADIEMNLNTNSSSNVLIFALCELFNNTGNAQYLDTARKIADNVIHKRFVNGYFVDGEGVYMAQTDSIDAFALLKLHATIIGTYESVPEYYGGQGYFEGDYVGDDGKVYKTLCEGEFYKLFKK